MIAELPTFATLNGIQGLSMGIHGDILNLIAELRNKGAFALVVSHNNPDGDALGSAVALSRYFQQTGIRSVAIVPNDFPPFLAWMEGADEVLVFYKNPERCKQLLSEASAIFCVDFNALKRTASLEGILSANTAPKVMIDHHPEPASEFNLAYSKIETSSTAELIYNLISADGGAEKIDKAIAEALYVGIMTDTGSFSYSCNYASTFEIAASLISKGLVPEKIHRRVYDTFTPDRMRLLGYSLGSKLVVLKETQTAYISLTQDELKRHNHVVGDTEGIVNYALGIEGIKVAALFTERKDHIRISFRSKGSFAINQIARDHYEGGGHRNAAGGNSYADMDSTLLRFEELIALYRDEILASDGD